MKTYKQFQENLVKNIGGKILGKTSGGRLVRSLALPDTISGTKIPFTNIKAPINKFTKALDPIYKSATDAMGTGPAAPVTFATSLLARSYGPTLSKIGKKVDKARTDTRKSIQKGLEKSGDKNSKFNANRYMSSFKNVDGKPLYPSSVPKV